MIAETSPLVRDGEDRWGDARPTWWQRPLRNLYDAAAAHAGARHLRRTIAAGGAIGAMLQRVGAMPPRAADVAALFPELTSDRCREVAREMAALYLKNRVARAIRRGGRRPIVSLVRWPSDGSGHVLQESSSGEIVVTFHIGAATAVGGAIRAVNPNAMVIRQRPPVTPETAAAALKRAGDHVRRGGLVILTLDGPGGSSTHEVDCLGHRIVFRRGAFAVSRLTRRPLRPVICGWAPDGMIDLRVGDPIEPTSEQLMASAVARWLDRYLRERPQDIPVNTFQYLRLAPRAVAR